MPTVPLPAEPSLEQLRKQAEDLLHAVRRGDPGAVAHLAEHHPEPPDPCTVEAARLALARHYGFASWPRLEEHLSVVARYQRAPDRIPAKTDIAAEFLRLACLTYGEDDPRRWVRARELLAAHPEIGAANIHVAAAIGDPEQVRRLLAADPGAASRDGGPYDWQPLCYLAYARHDPDVAAEPVLATARLLLDAGADPNAGYLWHGLPSPFTVLTGAFGHGERGPARQPAHPHSIALARLLLDAGADPNDGQALYNRMFTAEDDHLRLLLAHGLGTGDGGPWRARLGDQLDTPTELVRRQLRWAILHGFQARVRLLVEHGADIHGPADGSTPVELAATSGHPDLVDYLVAKGAATPRLDPVDAFVAAALVADRATIDRLRADDPDIVDRARKARPALIVWAAGAGRTDAIRLLVGLGFDINAMGRTDVSHEQPWQTALHHAAGNGLVELAGELLALGADPDIRDHRFTATPLGWAEHFDQTAMIDLLGPLTTAD